MAYKIYTYTDPYSLHKADFWGGIKSLPHFCASRTLVNGFADVLGDNIEGLFCPLDDFVNHQDVYKSWTDNIGLRIKQYSFLTAMFKKLFIDNKIDEPFYKALQHNQNHFLDAVRLFVELSISPCALRPEMSNREQKLFIDVLSAVCGNPEPLFAFPSTPGKEKIKSIIERLSIKELDDFNAQNRSAESEYVQKKLKRLNHIIKTTHESELHTIVVHGVNQFSPAQLRLILDLERMGIDIVFLYNYQHQFSEIYSSWDYIYKHFDALAHHDANIRQYTLNCLPNRSHALGLALGELCEGSFDRADSNLHKQFDLYKECELREFGNVTEYATFVSNHFEKALGKFTAEQSIIERANRVMDTSAVLRLLDEQVYTANKDVHVLLNIYYPQFSQDRHFLSYPIGQFFSALYRLWNWERGEIDFDLSAIKECLSSGILSAGTPERMLRTAYHLDVLLDDIETYSDFRKSIEDKYLSLYDAVLQPSVSENIAALRRLSIYNKYKIKKADITALVKALQELNCIAVSLFSPAGHEDNIDFGSHFDNLEAFIKNRQPDLANEEERTLIAALLLRFDQVKGTSADLIGTFDDLKNGLYFYLKQKDEGSQTDWIVKNFEQIDGDVLQSRGQFLRGDKKVYHFACVSDRDLNRRINDLLPWPLTDTFIGQAYSPIDLQFQVYYAALGERSNFLRYALFYGLYFNYCDVRLSYVKQYGDEKTEPYALLKLLGVNPRAIGESIEPESSDISVSFSPKPLTAFKYDRYQMMNMFLCPHRYFLGYVMNAAPVLEGTFLYQKFFENILIENTWMRIAQRPKQSISLEQIVMQEADRVSAHFWFWKRTEIDDLKKRAINYLQNKIINADSNALVQNYSQHHMQMRKHFGKALFEVDISESEPINPYVAFERLSQKSYPRKKYSLYALPRSNESEKHNFIMQSAQAYLGETIDKDKAAVCSEWCAYCQNRRMCMESYLQAL